LPILSSAELLDVHPFPVMVQRLGEAGCTQAAEVEQPRRTVEEEEGRLTEAVAGEAAHPRSTVDEAGFVLLK